MPTPGFRVFFAAAAVSMLSAGCDIKVDEGRVSLGVSRGRATDEWTRSYAAVAGGELDILNKNGAIEARGVSGTQITVKAEREVSDRSDDEARKRLQALKMREDVTAGRVSIEAETGESGPFGMSRGVSIRYEVGLPPGLTVSFKTQNGQVRLENVQGRITAASTNGQVQGEGIVGAVDASTVNGSVQMDLAEVTGEVRLATVNGAVRVQLAPTANVDVDAQTVNGGVSVDERLKLTGVPASRPGPRNSLTGRLNEGGHRVSLQTTNGGIRVVLRGSDAASEQGSERGPGRRRE
jgi:cytoskeletal protein CcmA (bactofilin family)